MERRKDTLTKGVNLPKEYLEMVEDVFNKNFTKLLNRKTKETFKTYGQIYPDEMVMAISLYSENSFRLITCYASVDPKPTPKASSADNIQKMVHQCVDAIAGFFQTYFDEGRPLDYDEEYRQSWTEVAIEPKVKVFVKITRDNLDLEAQADAILELDEQKKKKKDLH